MLSWATLESTARTMLRRDEVKPETWAIVAGRPAPLPGATLNTPIVAASTYVLGSERIYSRNEATEGWESFEAMLGGLEGGEAVAFASGMAACAAVLGQLPTAAYLVLVDNCYQGVAGIAEAGARNHQWRVERLPAADPRWLQRASEADLLWLESPTNPLLDVADLPGICAAPRRPGTRLVVDNTFATPLLQRPLELGADIVVHSATKLIGGHSDLLLGAAVTADAESAAATACSKKSERGHSWNARMLPRATRRADAAAAAAPRPGIGPTTCRAAGRSPCCRSGALSRVRHDRELRTRRRRGCRSSLPRYTNHPARNQPRWSGDVHGAA